MKLTLRKAHALQKELTNELVKLDFDTEIEISEFEAPEKKIADTVDVFEDQLVKRKDILDTLYTIRKAIAKANHEKDVDLLLADLAHLDSNISFYKQVLRTTEPRVHGEILKGKLDKIRKRDDSAEPRLYGRSSDTVTTHVFTADALAEFEKELAEFKKTKQTLQDKLLEINFQTEIDLANDQEAVLRGLNLI